jgi:hypothetical protein
MRGSFTCRKVGRWDRLFNFPSEGRHAEYFYVQKNPTASAGFEPANSGAKGNKKRYKYYRIALLSVTLYALEDQDRVYGDV